MDSKTESVNVFRFARTVEEQNVSVTKLICLLEFWWIELKVSMESFLMHVKYHYHVTDKISRMIEFR